MMESLTEPLKPQSLIQAWRQGLEVGDIVRLRHIPTGRSLLVSIHRTTVRMVMLTRDRGVTEIRIMRRDGLNYGGPKNWKIERPT